MRPNRTLVAAVVAATEFLLWVPLAGAQSRPDPSNPAARVPAAAYRSPFEGYRKLGEEPVGNWRAANDEVGRIGGWREYAREAQKPAAGPAPKTGHEGHKHGSKP